ncbi:MAG: chromosome segregation protein SMC [Candidatus Parabeggiatoa sp. nov. 1]|nr:MAG: chromosome segregation protein SMC [Gammaproteobacteria bacterium]
MKIESIRIKNFRLFQNVTINQLPNCCVFVGANGTGKTSLFDLFGFLHDALTYNVTQALEKRGGFFEVVSRGTSGPIELELKFRDLKATSAFVTYLLVIDFVNNQPVVKREILKLRSGTRAGGLKHFLDFSLGRGKVITHEQVNHKRPDTKEKFQEEQLISSDILAIKVLGQLQRFEIISELCRFIEKWHLSDFQQGEIRSVNKAAGYNKHLSSSGDNLARFAQTIYDKHPDTYRDILRKMARRVPGVAKVEPVTENGRILLKFQESAFDVPFLSWQVSDGTISLLAYLLLLHDPNPHPLLCVEEPDRQLYPHLLRELAEEFSLYALMGESQIFVSTHSPDFLNGAELTEIFWLEAQKSGYTQMHRAAESQLLHDLVSDGELPGALWKQTLLEDANLP